MPLTKKYPPKPWVNGQRAALLTGIEFYYSASAKQWIPISPSRRTAAELAESFGVADIQYLVSQYDDIDSDLKAWRGEFYREITEWRTTADSDRRNIFSELEHSRLSGDSDLSDRVSFELHNRIGADSDLNVRLVFLENKREDSEQLDYKLDSEEHDRKAGDSDILTRGDSDRHDFIARDSELKYYVDSELRIVRSDADSETHDRKSVDSDLWHKLSEVDSDLAILFGRTDSDDLTLQDLRTHAEQMIDSERHDWQAADSELTKDLDSEIHDLKAKDSDQDIIIADNDSEIKRMLDSERHDRKAYDSDIWHKLREVDSDLAVLLGRTDSDDLTLQDLRTHAEQMIDSERHDWLAGDSDVNVSLTKEIHDRTAADSDLRKYVTLRLDSDELNIQANLTYIEGRLDSDESFLQHISTTYVKTVNGISADINNNVILSIVGVQTGTEDQKRDSIAPGQSAIGEGDVWVVSGDSDVLNDGRSYIYDSDSATWNRISGFDTAQADARYVNLAGDTMLGSFALAGDPTLNEEAANKHYVDAKDSDAKVSLVKEVHDRKAGDSDLGTRINEEIHDRKAADSDLQIQIFDNDSDILMEIHDRAAADSDLSDRITKEVHDRAAADSDLQVQIFDNDSDILALQGMDSDLQVQIWDNDSDILMEIHDRKSTDSDLSDRISLEVHDRMAADSDIRVDHDSDRFWGGVKTSQVYNTNTGGVRIQRNGGDFNGPGQLLLENTTASGEVSIAYTNVETGANYWFTGLNQDNEYAFAYGTTFNDSVNLINILSTGQVGIGTLTPGADLHVYKDGVGGDTGVTDMLRLEINRGDHGGVPSGPAILFKDQDTNNPTNEARIKMMTVNDVDYGDNDEGASNLVFETTNGGVASDKLFVAGDGRIGIGNSPIPTNVPFAFDPTGASDPDGLGRAYMLGDGTGVINGGTW